MNVIYLHRKCIIFVHKAVKTPTSFIKSVQLSIHSTNSTFTERTTVKFYIESAAKNLSRRCKFGSIGTKISGVLYEDLCTFDAAECNMSLNSPKCNLLLALPCPQLTLSCWNVLLNFSTPVFKMRIIQEPKKVALWNKRHFEEKKMKSAQHV